MKSYFLWYPVFLSIMLLSCKQESKTIIPEDTAVTEEKFCIVIHGGAGTITKENITDSLEQAFQKVLDKAVSKGYEILQRGGSSLDAVTQTIMILEDSPLFNAGKGAVFTHEGHHELDASIMDGRSQAAGAVAGVRRVKNPVLLARAVMEVSDHVFLSGSGAEQFARDQGIELIDPDYFYTKNRKDALMRAREKEELVVGPEKHYVTEGEKFGTVGCVALDKKGNIAAGTSTGGMTNKRYGRIGDSPIIGAGTYAHNEICGVSATGWGEFFIRSVASYDIASMVQYKGVTLEEACREVILKKIPEMGGDGGVIAIDRNGTIVTEFSTPGMFRASVNVRGEKEIAIYGKSRK